MKKATMDISSYTLALSEFEARGVNLPQFGIGEYATIFREDGDGVIFSGIVESSSPKYIRIITPRFEISK